MKSLSTVLILLLVTVLPAGSAEREIITLNAVIDEVYAAEGWISVAEEVFYIVEEPHGNFQATVMNDARGNTFTAERLRPGMRVLVTAKKDTLGRRKLLSVHHIGVISGE